MLFDVNTSFLKDYDIKIITENIIGFGMYPQERKKDTISIIGSRNKEFLGSDGCAYTVGSDGNYYKNDYIIWRAFEKPNHELLLLSELIIDTRRYDSQFNNYENSEIRKWLNNDFLESAFNSVQRKLIQNVEVDNSIDSTGAQEANGYLCNNTSDNVFLLSNFEVISFFELPESRRKMATDYALSKGLYAFPRCGCWWLRSPFFYCSDDAWLINIDGTLYPKNNVKNPHYGIVPAIIIDIRSANK